MVVRRGSQPCKWPWAMAPWLGWTIVGLMVLLLVMGVPSVYSNHKLKIGMCLQRGIVPLGMRNSKWKPKHWNSQGTLKWLLRIMVRPFEIRTILGSLVGSKPEKVSLTADCEVSDGSDTCRSWWWVTIFQIVWTARIWEVTQWSSGARKILKGVACPPSLVIEEETGPQSSKPLPRPHS